MFQPRTEFASRYYMRGSVMLSLLSGSPLGNFGIRA